ncbi:hypothetical protein EVAR_9655_1 [Eumeta japonica]|uniref:Uncharacterized protein n=1 Tax=Eumeta variegata TaxID=151549 RepID=A0A4C1TL27_EUMVA|nr:hypothetical protein EVAR_9655_1 [Eumeta japonica]
MQVQGFVKRDINNGNSDTSAMPYHVIIQHTTQLKNCLDQHLAGIVGEVKPEKFKPVIDMAGDEVNKILKTWSDLTAAFTPAPDAKADQL